MLWRKVIQFSELNILNSAFTAFAFIFKSEYKATFKPLLLHYNIVDVHFLAVIWILSLYNFAVSFLFFVVPTKREYIYSLISQQTNRTSWQFVFFFLLEVYLKGSQSFMLATDGLGVFPVALAVAFWLKFCR